jgi:type III secretion protein V
MPGKQMAIDGDMRAGTIDMDEAKRRRRAVEKESQLYGAMDGAMKFVKGDAIAGLIIVAVNLLGGILIGMLQRGMTAGKAMQTYSILSIGDGLISQIPALFISICAGIIVTRVQSDEGPSNVGKDIGSQIMAQPRALIIGGCIALGMGFIPGMPSFVFLLLGIPLIAMGIAMRPRRQIDEKTGEITEVPALAASDSAARKPTRGDGTDEFVPTVPLILDVADNLRTALKADELNDELIKIRRALYFDLGVPFPGIQLRFNDRLDANTYHIVLTEVPVAQGMLRIDQVLVRESADKLSALGVEFEKDRAFLPGVESVWVATETAELLSRAGMSFMNPTQILTFHLATVLRKYSAEFIGVQETRFLLGAMEQRFPDLVKEATRVMPTQKIGEILQRLVSEDISIRNLRTILESLVEWGQKEKDSVLLTEYVRGSLKRQISFKYSSGQNMLPAYLLAPKVEETVRSAIRQTSAGSYLALDPAASRKLVDNLKKAVGKLPTSGARPVLLASMDIRRYMRKLIEADLYDLQVLSYQELVPEVNIQPLARVDL